MNKKGFTLIELLATITILALLVVMASTSVSKVIKDTKKDLSSSQMKLIEASAKTWGAENTNKLPKENGECIYITIKDLKDLGFLTSDIKDPKNNEPIQDNINIKITGKLSKYSNYEINYEVNPSDIDGCSYANACKLISGDKDTAGSKYECEVKPGTKYNFYVLSWEDNGTTNLILDRNICEDGTVVTSSNICEVEWYADDYNNSYGPVTAMDFLYNATKKWTNIPNIQMNYEDEISSEDYGYGTIKTTNNVTKITMKDGTAVPVLTNQVGYTNLKARMPYASDIKSYTTSTRENAFLYDNMDGGQGGIIEDGITNISGVFYYWTLSSSTFDEGGVTVVSYSGGIEIDSDSTCVYGVRPVINVKL